MAENRLRISGRCLMIEHVAVHRMRISGWSVYLRSRGGAAALFGSAGLGGAACS